MKALTLTQPWATLVAMGEKKIETRSWSTTYRGPLFIHAAKGMPRYALDAFISEPFYNATFVPAGILSSKDLPRGKVIAMVQLMGCRRTEDVAPQIAGTKELAFGDYSPGRWAWFLSDVVWFGAEHPARGALGLWDWTMPLPDGSS